MTKNLKSASASFAKLGSNSFFEILPKSIVTENKCLRYAAMKRLHSACLIFPLTLSIAIPPKKCMALHAVMMLWQRIIKSPPPFFFYLKKSLMFPFCVILNFQFFIPLKWVLLLVQEMHALACITQGHMEKLPPCCSHVHNHPAL